MKSANYLIRSYVSIWCIAKSVFTRGLQTMSTVRFQRTSQCFTFCADRNISFIYTVIQVRRKTIGRNEEDIFIKYKTRSRGIIIAQAVDLPTAAGSL